MSPAALGETAAALAAIALLAAPRPAAADLLNDAALDAHVDAVVARTDPAHRAGLRPDRVVLDLGLLVPVLGTYRLDRAMFGGVRPSGVVFDWVLGGVVPAALGIAALASSEPRDRAALGWTALGMYVATRIGVLVIGNLHISEFDRRLELRLGGAVSATGRLAPVLAAHGRW